jgi:metallophosphoesterase superfamily enzyme
MGRIPGYKILVNGNHDGNTSEWFLNHGFDEVHDALLHDRILFTHEPFDISKFTAIENNIHGHFHRAVRDEADRTALGYDFYTKNHAYLSIEEEDYKPISISEFIMKKF